MPYTIRKRKCKQSDGDQGSYVLSYTSKKGKKRSACHTSKKKARGQIAAIEMPRESEEESDIREFIRSVLMIESAGRLLDRATNQISRSAVDAIKSREVRERHANLADGAQLQLRLADLKDDSGSGRQSVDASLVDIDTVGEIVLILEATEGELWTAGAYQYNPSDRTESVLIVALGLPRSYDLSVLSLVIPELKEAIRHELEHGTESTEVLQRRDTDLPDNHFESKASMIAYYTQGGETSGHVTGLYKKAKDLKVPVPEVINDFLVGIYQRAIEDGMSEADADDGTGQIAKIWYEYLTSRYPESRKYLSF